MFINLLSSIFVMEPTNIEDQDKLEENARNTADIPLVNEVPISTSNTTTSVRESTDDNRTIKANKKSLKNDYTTAINGYRDNVTIAKKYSAYKNKARALSIEMKNAKTVDESEKVMVKNEALKTECGLNF